VGTQFLVCNEIGRSGAKGGVSPASGDTPRGDSIADFDHIRRRFADWPVVERRVFPILPTDDSFSEPGKYVSKVTPAHPTWENGDVINIDLDSLDATGLGDWSNASGSGAPVGGAQVSNLWPPGTTVTDVLTIIHDDGNFGGAISKNVEVDQVVGIGTNHIQIRLGENTRQANGGLPVVQATAQATVVANPSTATLTIGGVALTDAGGPRLSGANNYNGTLGSPALIAADIVAAINDGANGFTAIATAVDGGGGVINLTAVPIGAAGNTITLATSDVLDITVSGALFANGTGTSDYDLVSAPTGAASPRRIWIELEITYPIGSGTTDTPDVEVTPDAAVYPDGPLIENDTSQRPADWEQVLVPEFREGLREVNIEYAANDGSGAGSGTPITDNIVSDTVLQISLPRRIFGSGTTVTTVTDLSVPGPVSVDTTATEYGSSSRKLLIQGGTPLSGAQTQVSVEYFAQDPLPNYGAVGYQISVYYRSNAPQTVGVQAGAPATYPLPASLLVRPLVMSRDLWTGTVGSGSPEIGFPYSNPLDQIAVNGDLVPATFPGEWVLQATAEISVGDFDAATGLLSLHQMSPADGNSDFTFTDKDVDSEFRAHYKVADPGAYRPTAMAQPLSGVAAHKVFFPFLARSADDNVYFRKDEVLLIVVSRFAILDGDNVVRFTDSNNETCAAVYRTRGLLLMASE
jgi:hypothetical protein